MSAGATRKFSFRDIPGLTNHNGDDKKSSKKTGNVHNFYVLDGDITEMFASIRRKLMKEGRCQCVSSLDWDR